MGNTEELIVFSDTIEVVGTLTPDKERSFDISNLRLPSCFKKMFEWASGYHVSKIFYTTEIN